MKVPAIGRGVGPMAASQANPQRRGADSTERAYAMLRQLVVEFQLRPNDRLNEVQMARQFALSRTPVREALNRLATEGFLSFVPNRGFFFRSPNIDDLVAIYEARAVLEKGAFALACARATPSQAQALQNRWAAARLECAKRGPDQILELDETFHLELAGLSRNQEFVRQLTAINARTRFVRRIEIERGPRQTTMIDAHDELVEALGKRAVKRGHKVLSRHISISIADAENALKEAVFQAYARTPAPSAA